MCVGTCIPSHTIEFVSAEAGPHPPAAAGTEKTFWAWPVISWLLA